MRVTAYTKASGQPRPYADSELVVELWFEIMHWKTKEWIPCPVEEDRARNLAEALCCGYVSTDRHDADRHWSDSYLASFTPNEDGSVWTFKVVAPFTD